MWVLYAVNAIWHGLEVGLYVSFFSLALMTLAGRKVGLCYTQTLTSILFLKHRQFSSLYVHKNPHIQPKRFAEI